VNDSENATRDDGRLLAWTALVAVSARAHRHPKATDATSSDQLRKGSVMI
jgi:hypothetical protein